MKALILVSSIVIMCSANLFAQATWFSLSSGLSYDNNSVYFLNDNTGFVATSNSTILRTSNGGINWQAITIEPYEAFVYLLSVHFMNSSTGFAIGGKFQDGQGRSYKTTNAGMNWFSAFNFPYTMMDVTFTNTTTGYAVGGDYPSKLVIYKSINGGLHWSSQIVSSINNFQSVEFLDLNTGFVVGHPSSIYKTTNGGITWSMPSINGVTTKYDIDFPTDSIGYISSAFGKVIKTIDKGATWSIISVLGISDNLYSTSFLSKNFGFVVGDGSTIAQTTDGGSTWEPNLSPSNQTLNSVYFPSANAGYAVGNSGTIIKTTNAGNSISGINLSLKILLEGLYSTTFDAQSRTDSIKAYLRQSISPYAKIDSTKGVLDSITFTGNFRFANAPSGTYYITLEHFQSIQTWSKPGGEVLTNNGSIYNYDFTTSASKAYGNNLKLKGSKYCIYTGDLNQSGFVDGTELSMVENDAANFVAGRYVLTDVDGDEIVDGSDYILIDNNAFSFIGVIRP